MFNLTNAIHRLLDSESERDPFKLGRKLLKQIPRRQRDRILEEQLVEAARDAIRNERHRVIRAAGEEVEDELEEEVAAKPATGGGSRVGGTVKRHRSKFTTYDQLLEMTVAVNARWRKPFGECDLGDIRELIHAHKQLATSNQARADNYKEVENLFKSNTKAKTVRDLPPDDLVRAMV